MDLNYALLDLAGPAIAPSNATSNSSAVCARCCYIYTARVKLDPSGYNSIQYFRGVTLLVLALTSVVATVLVGRQQKRRPDINSFQRKLLLFTIGIIVIHMVAGILPLTMGSIVVAYGYGGKVPWYLWFASAVVTGATWTIAWFIAYIFYFTPHRAGWKQLIGPPAVLFIILSTAQFLGAILGRNENIWWGYIAAEIILLPCFIFFFVNSFVPILNFYPRPVLRYWAAYLMLMHTFYITTYILIEKAQESQYCIALAAESLFCATFALVIYFVLRSDGKYLAEETAPLLDMANDGTLNLIPWNELEIERDIKGAGSQGTVFKARWGSELVAVKKIMMPPLPPTTFGMSTTSTYEAEEAINALSREASYLVELRHPSIVQFYGITKLPEGKDTYGLVTKYMEHNLFSVIQDQVISQATPISWATRLKWIRDVSFGLRYLHSKSINHGDIKSMNVLLSADLQLCQLCDFGSAGRAATATMHTPQWSAPEVLRSELYSRKSDVYSFGILVWEIVTFHHPYERKSVMEAQNLIRSGHSPLNLWPELTPGDTPSILLSIMGACLAPRASKRPTMESICTLLMSSSESGPTWPPTGEDSESDVESSFVTLAD